MPNTAQKRGSRGRHHSRHRGERDADQPEEREAREPDQPVGALGAEPGLVALHPRHAGLVAAEQAVQALRHEPQLVELDGRAPTRARAASPRWFDCSSISLRLQARELRLELRRRDQARRRRPSRDCGPGTSTRPEPVVPTIDSPICDLVAHRPRRRRSIAAPMASAASGSSASRRRCARHQQREQRRRTRGTRRARSRRTPSARRARAISAQMRRARRDRARSRRRSRASRASRNPKYVSESSTDVNSTCAGSSAITPPAKIAATRSNSRRAMRNTSAAVSAPKRTFSRRAAFTRVARDLVDDRQRDAGSRAARARSATARSRPG